MFDSQSGSIPVRRTTEGLSESLKNKTIQQRPKRMPGEKEDDRPFKELAEEREEEEKKVNEKKGESKGFLDVIGKGGDERFSKALAKSALESGRSTGKELKSFAPMMNPEEVAEAVDAKIPVAKNDKLIGEEILPVDQPLKKFKDVKVAQVPVKKKIDAAELADSRAAAPVQPEKEEPLITLPGEKPLPAPVRKDLASLVKQMAAHIQTVTTADRTETTITLRHPPTFAGAEVTLIERANSRGEFNVAFTNLSPQAKALVDNAQNQSALKLSMEDKGFPLHIIVTSAQEREALIAEAKETFDREEQDPEKRRQQQKKQQEQDQADA